ncbi:MAG TPA: hypothetical protein VNI57_11430, partial [Candidatus Saccharimonadales bacterium]|nr:hypothetical protein [Candidatus Saccharimonadales bacterium]
MDSPAFLPAMRTAGLLAVLAGAALPLAAGTHPPHPSPAPPVPYAVALEHYRAHRYAEAARVLEEAAARGEAKGGHLSLLGWCYVQLKRYGEA